MPQKEYTFVAEKNYFPQILKNEVSHFFPKRDFMYIFFKNLKYRFSC